MNIYYNKINEAAQNWFKVTDEDEFGFILDEIEKYMTKRLYSRFKVIEFVHQAFL